MFEEYQLKPLAGIHCQTRANVCGVLLVKEYTELPPGPGSDPGDEQVERGVKEAVCFIIRLN